MNDTMSSLLNQLVVDLEARKFERYSDEFLLSEIKLAIGEINRCRNFTPTDTALYDSKYEYLIIPMVRSSIAKIGAEGKMFGSISMKQVVDEFEKQTGVALDKRKINFVDNITTLGTYEIPIQLH